MWILRLLIGSLAVAAAPSLIVGTYTDVAATDSFYDAVTTLSAKHIVAGYPDGTFKPNTSINRAEFLKIILSSIADSSVIETCLAVTPQTLFSDTPRTEWYAKYVCTAKKFSVIYGYPDGTFKPTQTINLAEASTILARGFGLNVNPPPDKVWFKPFLQTLLEKHMIPYTLVRFDQLLTRGEMAEMVYRITSGITNRTSPTYAQLEQWTGRPLPGGKPLQTLPANVLGPSLRVP